MTTQTMQFLVDDMMCNGCEDTIQHELRHTQGVSHVSANHIEGTVEVTGNAELSTLVDQVNELGFTANEG